MTISENCLTEEVPKPLTQIVNPTKLYDPAPYGYSHVVIANKVAYIAGQGGEDSEGKLENDFAKQVRQAYKNLFTALEAINTSPNNVSKLTTYVVNYDQSMLETMTKELVSAFGEHLPAQTLVPVPRLAIDGMLFEVDAIAIMEKD
ncbi:RidA family protein [Agaribacterium sp. ZY112]|uniref:RidA family protein n=1 Tax=Agaribacterium sp. ZY112 TaxID=3233574 RepID=UPI0035253699